MKARGDEQTKRKIDASGRLESDWMAFGRIDALGWRKNRLRTGVDVGSVRRFSTHINPDRSSVIVSR